MVREVLTLQLGNYANYVGTHWWNIQESSFNYDPTAEPSDIEHTVLYREGETRQRQPTFTPRLLMLDLAGTLRHLPRTGDLYEEELAPAGDTPYTQTTTSDTDSGAMEVIKQEERYEPHPFQADLNAGLPVDAIGAKNYDFRNTVHSWSDYSYARYHPRSINMIERYAHSPTEGQFDTFPHGRGLWQEVDFQDHLVDRIRQYIEECDECQGFQTLFDCTDAFTGLTIGLLEHLHDEYGKASLVFPLFAPRPPTFKGADEATSDSIRVVNTGLAFAHLPEHCSLFAPLATMAQCWRTMETPRPLPGLSYDPHSLYQTSAILAGFLDTVTLRYRMRGGASGGHLAGLCSDLNAYGRRIVAGVLAMPFPMDATQDLIDCLDQLEGKQLLASITPGTGMNTGAQPTRGVVQSVCVRGLPEHRLKRPPTAKGAQRQQRMAGYRCNSVSEMLQLFFSCTLPVSMSHVTATRLPLPVRQPFPVELFDGGPGGLSFDGFRTNDPQHGQLAPLASIPTLAALQSSTNLGQPLEALHREVRRVRPSRIPRFADCGLDTSEYDESLEQLLQLKEQYDDNYSI
ncbi:protein misato-like [Anopheles aquasalis]|uniref:protein misato-like n=1 Tax=Anopheles aquasalis TaxID=42839 RepID=UPI00215A2032|nr:protein misato-like [Anopheles aquasalis]